MPSDWTLHDVIWLAVNILAPVLLPAMLIFLFKLTVAGSALKFMDTVKDGQLCWFAITLSFSMYYDLIEAAARHPDWAPTAELGMAILCLFSGSFVGVASIQPTPAFVPVATAGPVLIQWLKHYRVFEASVVFCFIAAWAAFKIHFLLAHDHGAG